jgi:hypothetical protein
VIGHDDGRGNLIGHDDQTTPPGFEPGQREPKNQTQQRFCKEKTKRNQLSRWRFQYASSARVDPDLKRILNAWPTLRAPFRAAMLAMIDAADKDPVS